MNRPKPPIQGVPIFMMIFMSFFGFIGLAVLIFLWSQPFNDFGSPPLIFRVVGSFIALMFMAMGFGLPVTALRNRLRGGTANDAGTHVHETQQPAAKGYACPHCGAGIVKDQEVSPSGDVKCTYCQKWWNIHRSIA